MDLLRITEMATRSHPQSLLPRLQAPARQCRRAFLSPTPRNFSTSSHRLQDHPPSDPSRTRSGVSSDISSLLDSALDGDKGTPAAPQSRTSKFKSSSYQPNNPRSRGAAMGPYQPSPGSSIDDLYSAMQPSRAGGRQLPQRGASRSSSDPNYVSRMLDPTNTNRPPPTVPDKSAGKLPFKLNASVGRTVYTNSTTMDPARAFRALEIQCARNSVRRDFQRQRFHERPGLKRKRLHSERWRRRFKEGFRGVVGLVQKMKKQGW
ncbi:hypothetical protein KC343_g3457 [Hortaea werneckii]|uniref:Ribosomal protein S21 n=1 Tax=Hortaea werneckii TaxID=91943 RepID=A0A3M7G507_HORWE|nr:hypothetical protein KC352_g11616 [Hortaea werneckii]KAI7570034.1 hypothetical protein KC317_g2818 [Hortaea werneckii]KAI7626852.1 hypothetical protein KC346_g1039 [Hortaea werneckii]KAI7632482.1 hypothetical protein KC343_g3457 [Hortaea werneckii]KAI7681821.1 hypothetical protein KC319_g1355 [Hortaea werneckii]